MIRKHRKIEEKQKGVLTFDHVSFKYPGADENVLEDITFTANREKRQRLSEVPEAENPHWSI